MPGKYTLRGTSRDSAKVGPIPLPSSNPNADKLTRRFAVSEVVANKRERKHSVKVSLVHQRVGAKGQWENSPAFNLVHLKAGEEVQLRLDTSQTWHLYQALRDLYAIGPENIPQGEMEVLVLNADSTDFLPGRAQEVVAYFQQYGPQLLDAVDQIKPDLWEAAALHKIYETRRQVVADFRRHMEERDWSEPEWQDFFDTNKWIFGHNLNYRILRTVQTQPTYGGPNVTGKGAQRGDTLLATEGAVHFTVLVEIKRYPFTG